MPVIDADTHVTECDDTFSYLEPDEMRFLPTKGEMGTPDGGPGRPYWLINGLPRMRSRWREDDIWRIRGQLLDVPERVRAMDEMGVTTQILYPTMFAAGGISAPDVEFALTRSYNRWLADKMTQSGGRIRWVMLPSLHNIEKTKEQMRWAKDHGAVGVLKKGDQEAGYWPAEPYFYPFYEEAEKLDLPICFHVGTGDDGPMPLERINNMTLLKFHMSNMSAFHGLITFHVTEMFPKLRWGFMEITASWIPYAMYYMRRILFKSAGRTGAISSVAGSTTYEVPDDVLDKNHIFVACFVDEDLPHILKYTGENSLLMGSDFVHHDHAEELDFMSALRSRADRGEFSHDVVRKITYDNPKAFYGL
jgi:predicted TIM-barrel fold metal-dependent hydrolase